MTHPFEVRVAEGRLAATRTASVRDGGGVTPGRVGFVYCFEWVHPLTGEPIDPRRYIKIGHTNDVTRRERSFNGAKALHPMPLRWKMLVTDRVELEKRVHQWLKDAGRHVTNEGFFGAPNFARWVARAHLDDVLTVADTVEKAVKVVKAKVPLTEEQRAFAAAPIYEKTRVAKRAREAGATAREVVTRYGNGATGACAISNLTYEAIDWAEKHGTGTMVMQTASKCMTTEEQTRCMNGDDITDAVTWSTRSLRERLLEYCRDGWSGYAIAVAHLSKTYTHEQVDTELSAMEAEGLIEFRSYCGGRSFRLRDPNNPHIELTPRERLLEYCRDGWYSYANAANNLSSSYTREQLEEELSAMEAEGLIEIRNIGRGRSYRAALTTEPRR